MDSYENDGHVTTAFIQPTTIAEEERKDTQEVIEPQELGDGIRAESTSPVGTVNVRYVKLRRAV